jgi:hypothetical protein
MVDIMEACMDRYIGKLHYICVIQLSVVYVLKIQGGQMKKWQKKKPVVLTGDERGTVFFTHRKKLVSIKTDKKRKKNG